MRRDDEYVGKRVMGIEVQGSRRGGLKKRWADCVKDDLREKGLSGEEVYDRAARRRLSSHIDPTYKWDKDEEEEVNYLNALPENCACNQRN